MGILASAEDDRADDLVALLQKLAGAVELGSEIVLANLRAQTDFLVLAVMNVAFVLPLFLLVLELAEVHDAADGRFLQRSDLNQVEPNFACLFQSIVATDYAQLRAVVADDTKRSGADLIVDPLLFAFDFSVLLGFEVFLATSVARTRLATSNLS